MLMHIEFIDIVRYVGSLKSFELNIEPCDKVLFRKIGIDAVVFSFDANLCPSSKTLYLENNRELPNLR